MPDYYGIRQFTGKKGPATYKPAKGGGKYAGKYSSHAQKPATDKKVSMVDKKVKRISNRIYRFKSKNPGPAANNNYRTI